VKNLKRGLIVVLGIMCVSIIAGMAFMFSSVKSVETLVDHIGEHLKEYNSKPTIIFSSNHEKLYEVYPVYSEAVNVSNLPKHVIRAVLAAEDKRFYEHPGVDYMGLLRVGKNVITRADNTTGGSTITMQLAKKLFSASEKNIRRKVQDISIAIQLEKRYTKDQILELYLNQIYYGEQAYGLNAAAEIYYGKKAEELDLAEAATIARCIRTPSKENPVKNYQLADANKIVVLDTMRDEGWITNAEYEKAKEEKPKVKGLSKSKLSRTYAAPYYVAAVKRELDKMGININEGGYLITTTLDTDLQAKAEEAVTRQIHEDRGYGVNVGAFICMDNQGRILADVGGRDFSKNQFSYTTQSMLQPGSSFKSFIYSEALKENVINEDSEISNEKISMSQGGNDVWEPASHGGYGGTVSLWSAFVHSLNIPAVHTYLNTGKDVSIDHIVEDFGFKSKLRKVPSAALGSNEVKMQEMLEAYSVFMLDGTRVHPYRIKEITSGNGDVLYQGKMDYVSTRIGPEICKVMDNLMRGVVTSGTGTRARECPDAHGKTGTTNDGKSGWFCGYAKGVVGIAWAGKESYDRRRHKWLLRPLPNYGGDVAAPMWARIMSDATEKFGSDVRPDFSVRQGEDGPRKRPRKEEQDSNNEELPLDDANNQPVDSNSAVPVTGEHDPEKTGGDNPTDPPKNPPLDGPPKTEIPEIKPPKEDKAKKHEKVADADIEVEVCADSGMLATRYCPETINKKMPKNKRPKKRCTIHKAPDETGGG
jgi:penicillin-binding protein 1A